MFEPLTPHNCNDAYALHQQTRFLSWSVNTFKDCLTSPYYAAQLSENNTFIGYHIGLQVLDDITLMDIAICSEFQGQGYGGKLLRHFLHTSKQRGGERVYLEVSASNKVAIYLYQKCGFEVLERRKNYYKTATGREDGLNMRLALP